MVGTSFMQNVEVAVERNFIHNFEVKPNFVSTASVLTLKLCIKFQRKFTISKYCIGFETVTKIIKYKQP